MKQGWKMGCIAVVMGCLATSIAHAFEQTDTEPGSDDFRFDWVELQLRTAEPTPQSLRSLGLMKLYGERLYGLEVAQDCTLAQNALTKAAAMGDSQAALILTKGLGTCQAKGDVTGNGV